MEDQAPRRPEWEGFEPEVLQRVISAAEMGYGPAQLLLAHALGMTVEDLAEAYERLQGVLDEAT
jgi:hypothetical protein